MGRKKQKPVSEGYPYFVKHRRLRTHCGCNVELVKILNLKFERVEERLTLSCNKDLFAVDI